MKILFMVNIPAPYRVDFFNELGKFCDLTVTFEGRRASDRNQKWIPETNKNFKEIYLRGIRTGTDHFFCPEILKIFREKWDVVIVAVFYTPTSMLAMEYMLKRHTPYYIETDGGFIKADKKWKYLIKKYFISRAKGWLTTGIKPKEYLEHYGAERDRCYIYPFTSIRKKDILSINDINKERKKRCKDQINVKEEKMVLTVSQVIPRKGLDILIEAANQVNDDIGFYIVGGKPTSELRGKFGKNVHFVDFKTKDELKFYYHAADLFVLPTREDTWGLVINEAMANGLPIITTDKCIAGLELVKNNLNGYIIPVDNVPALLEGLISILQKEDVLFRMGKSSLEIIQEYTIEKMVERHMEIFKNLI